MVVENRSALREALSRFRRQLDRLEADLDEPDDLLDAAQEGKRTRDSLPVVKRSLLPPNTTSWSRCPTGRTRSAQ